MCIDMKGIIVYEWIRVQALQNFLGGGKAYL